MPLEVSAVQAPRTVRLAGEVDVSNAEDLAARLEIEGAGPGDLTLDFSQVTFIDSSGVRGLLRAADELAGRGNLIIESASPAVRRVLDLMGLGGQTSGLVVRASGERSRSEPESRRFDADRATLAEIREFIRGRAVRDSFGHVADSMVLAVSEACANAILHSGSRSMRVTWLARDDRAEIEIRDDGTFRRAISDPGDAHSRGILLMVSAMDQVTITCGTDMRPGTVVRMVKFRNGRSARRQFGTVGQESSPFPRSSKRVAS